jgi:predicted DNA-binding protein
MSTRTELITVRISQQEKERFFKLAEAKGKPLAELIRYLLERECEKD